MNARALTLTTVLLAGTCFLVLYARRQTGTIPVLDTGDTAALPTNNKPPLGFSFLSELGNFLGMSTPLGLRCNNPGNLRFIADPSHAWRGQLSESFQGFGNYISVELGCRAMGHQIAKYYASGLRTVRQIVTKWAPKSENDTEDYISDVCQRLNVLENQPLNLPAQLGDLMAAMIIQEQGYNPFNAADLQSWGTES